MINGYHIAAWVVLAISVILIIGSFYFTTIDREEITITGIIMALALGIGAMLLLTRAYS